MTESECEACRATWSWNDGTEMSWWNWSPREPGISECGRLSEDGWAEYECSAKYRFICERGRRRKFANKSYKMSRTYSLSVCAKLAFLSSYL